MATAMKALVAAVAIAFLFDAAMAASYIVGAPSGSWDLNTDFNAWARSNTFLVGDTLVFQYGSTHDVLQVIKANYDSCGTSSPISTNTGGNTNINLTTPGKMYFICGTPGHCPPMKVEIDVLAASAGSPPTPSAGASPSPTGSTTPPPPSSGAAGGGLNMKVLAGAGLGMMVALAM